MTAPDLPRPRVLSTRAAVDQGPFEEMLRARGLLPVCLPCIAFGPPTDPAPLRAALAALAAGARPDWVVLASAHAVERFAEEVARAGVPAAALAALRFAAVGEGSAAALRALGARELLIPERGAGALALLEVLAPRVAGQRILAPRAEEGTPALLNGLVAAGAQVDAVALYRTSTPEAADPAGLAALRAGVAAIAFASGSAARGFCELLGPEAPALSAEARVVCMGPACAKAAREVGLRVDSVAHGGFPELAEAVARAALEP